MGVFNEVLTPEQLKGNEIPAGWYPFEITKYEEVVTKDKEGKPSDGSMNAVFYCTGLDGAVKGRELRRYFNQKFMQAGKNLWPLIIPNWDNKKGGTLTSEAMASSVGKKFMGYVKKGQNGFDGIEDFKPLAG